MRKALSFVGHAAWEFISCPNDGNEVTMKQVVLRAIFVGFMLMATWMMVLVFVGSNDKIAQTGAAVAVVTPVPREHQGDVTQQELDLEINQAKIETTQQSNQQRINSLEDKLGNLDNKLDALDNKTTMINTIVDRLDKQNWLIWALVLERLGSFAVFAMRKKKEQDKLE